MIKLESKTLKNYYGGEPNEYDLKFIHYNIDVFENTKEEYELIYIDLMKIKELLQEDFRIYFSDINNLSKIINNTNIVNEYKDDIYLRIRNREEYEEYKKLNIKINLLIEIKDIEKINLEDEKITIQIDSVNELSLKNLDNLLNKYNITEIAVGQIAYITEEYDYLLDELAEMFDIDKNNQLELEKNNKITNDIYDVSTYKDILNKITNIIEKNRTDNDVSTFINVFNYIAENIYYANDGVENTKSENQNLIGPLFNNKCVCEGYSKLLDQVCSLLNIESIIVSGGGSKEDGGHIWNQVCINDIWYNADVTAASWSIHNNENWNLCLVSDENLRYKATSPFKHICKDNYDNVSTVKKTK